MTGELALTPSAPGEDIDHDMRGERAQGRQQQAGKQRPDQEVPAASFPQNQVQQQAEQEDASGRDQCAEQSAVGELPDETTRPDYTDRRPAGNSLAHRRCLCWH